MWNPLSLLKEKIRGQGGFVNAHAHFDRAYSIQMSDFLNTQGNIHSHLFEKWSLVDKFKANADEDLYYQHITTTLRLQKEQGVQACVSFIDCDPIAEERALRASVRAKEYASKELNIRFLTACQTLKGILKPETRSYFEKALAYVDIIGGLPGADAGQEAEHIDILLQAAKETKKRVHVHVDQLNSQHEKETELLARKIIQWGVEGQVSAVHGISIAAHKKEYRFELYKLCKDAGLSFIACPTAWIDSRRSEIESPTHNAVTPIDEMIPAGLIVALGSDNICDIYKPYADGDMFTELRVLLESTHFYEMDQLINIATINGLKVLGIN